jgi:glutaminyl-peptide cyclotransferase
MLLRKSPKLAGVAVAAVLFVACGHGASPAASGNPVSSTAAPAAAQSMVATADAAPPASQTGGFDGAKAYDQVAKLVAFGPRPPASDAIHRTQDYIREQLKSFGCVVDEDDFSAQTPIGAMVMKNIIAKVPGTGQGIIVLLTHYDTLRLDNFVGADDAGSSTGLMLEMARNLCATQKQPNSVWIAFLDGEEAQVVVNGNAQWTAADSVYGSRELAARMAVSGDLKKIKGVILADMIGQKNLALPREADSTRWLTDLVWRTANRLGYKDVFISREEAVSDDHDPFLHRGVPSVDIIEYSGYVNLGYWHTPEDTLDKISPRSLAIVGHVIIESVSELQKR